MGVIDIIALTAIIIVIAIILGIYVSRKVKGQPTGECSACSSRGKKLVKQYRRTYKKHDENNSKKS